MSPPSAMAGALCSIRGRGRSLQSVFEIPDRLRLPAYGSFEETEALPHQMIQGFGSSVADGWDVVVQEVGQLRPEIRRRLSCQPRAGAADRLCSRFADLWVR